LPPVLNFAWLSAIDEIDEASPEAFPLIGDKHLATAANVVLAG
jgi:hypothetical protein